MHNGIQVRQRFWSAHSVGLVPLHLRNDREKALVRE